MKKKLSTIMFMLIGLIGLMCSCGNDDHEVYYRGELNRNAKIYRSNKPDAKPVEEVEAGSVVFTSVEKYDEATSRVPVCYYNNYMGFVDKDAIRIIERLVQTDDGLRVIDKSGNLVTVDGHVDDTDNVKDGASAVEETSTVEGVGAADGKELSEGACVDERSGKTADEPSFLSRCWDWLSDTWLYKIVKWGLILLGIGLAIMFVRFVLVFVGSTLVAGLFGYGFTWVFLKLLNVFHLFPEDWISPCAEVMAWVAGIAMLVYNIRNWDDVLYHSLYSKATPSSPSSSSSSSNDCNEPINEPIVVTDENGHSHFLYRIDGTSTYTDSSGHWKKEGNGSFYNEYTKIRAW